MLFLVIKGEKNAASTGINASLLGSSQQSSNLEYGAVQSIAMKCDSCRKDIIDEAWVKLCENFHLFHNKKKCFGEKKEICPLAGCEASLSLMSFDEARMRRRFKDQAPFSIEQEARLVNLTATQQLSQSVRFVGLAAGIAILTGTVFIWMQLFSNMQYAGCGCR